VTTISAPQSGVVRSYRISRGDVWHKMLELLKFELKFVEDGGYGRSPRTPWRPPYIFEDSPSCPNLGDSARPHGGQTNYDGAGRNATANNTIFILARFVF
jgi:hypothetical protein